ncbi:MAG: C2H2-type zinc finger protein, partial [Candidatus Thermoplasmatota archaeon]|nr:C2H2-type zinc finger protein [Candidatus Thermoplasmatota archaeon]
MESDEKSSNVQYDNSLPEVTENLPADNSHKSPVANIKRIRNNQEAHKCKYCEISFSTKYNLDYHMKLHNGEKPFSCSDCQSAFRTSKQLKLHQLSHTGEKPHKCNVCAMAFNCSGELKRH